VGSITKGEDAMPKPDKLVLVCNKQRPAGHPKGCCPDRGAVDLAPRLRELRDEKGLSEKVAVTITTTGCLGPCTHGPIVVVMPDNIWYKQVGTSDLEEIVDSHLVGGRPVERLILHENEWLK